MSFEDFMKTCCNWHIQSETTVFKYDKVIYKGEWCYMPRMLRKCYFIKRFYITNVTERKITLFVVLKNDYSNKLYNHLKDKYMLHLIESNYKGGVTHANDSRRQENV